MKIPSQTTPVLWGAAGGALILAVVGFSWGGWMTNGTAQSTISTRVDAAFVEALTPVCVAKFRRDGAAEENLVALKKIDSWSKGTFIEKGGWATVVDSKATSQLSSVARACGEVLSKPQI